MPWYCCVLNCGSWSGNGPTNGTFSMHKFPDRSVEPERYQKWQAFCQFSSQPGVSATICSLHFAPEICSLHFAPEMFVRAYQSDLTGPATPRHRILRNDAVPSVSGPAAQRARALKKTSAAHKTNQIPVENLTGAQKSREPYDCVDTGSTNLPSLRFSEDNADYFVSMENLPIFCKPCKQYLTGGPCWTHARTVPDRISTPLAITSLPEVLYFEPTDEVLGKSVHTSVFIPLHTVFGPLIAPLYVRSPSLPSSCRDAPNRLDDFQFENDHFCNWFKYVRTAADPTEQNLAICFRGIDVMFIATRSIQPHEELKVYQPLLTGSNSRVGFLSKNSQLESDVVRDDTAVNDGAVWAATLEAQETDLMLDSSVLSDGAKTVGDFISSFSADDKLSTHFVHANQAEPETPRTKTSSDISSDVVLYCVLPRDDTLHSRRTQAEVTARSIERSAVFERDLAGDIQVTKKRFRQSTARRPDSASFGEPLAARSLSVTSVGSAKRRTAPLPAIPGAVNENVSNSRLLSLQKRRSTPLRSHTSTLNVDGNIQAANWSNNSRFSSNGFVCSSRASDRAGSHAPSASTARELQERRREARKEKMNHVKKPLNAFMLYMRKQRAQMQGECTQGSATINQILGEKWHSLDHAEQSRYYGMAKQERDKHAQTYPGWTAKDNYALCRKKKRREKQKSDEPKKCRAVFGISRRTEWCKPCRLKKKCIRYSQNGSLLMNVQEQYLHDSKSA